jgi:hypothetical protein
VALIGDRANDLPGFRRERFVGWLSGELRRGRPYDEVVRQVIAATDPTGKRKEPDEPMTVADRYANIPHGLGIDPAQEVITPIGRPMKYSEGTAIERLLALPT